MMAWKYPFKVVVQDGNGIEFSNRRTGELLPSKKVGAAKIEVAVNAATGNLYVADHKQTPQERFGTLSLYYCYNSYQNNGAWRFALKALLSPSDNKKSLTLIERDGHQSLYTYDDNLQMYIAPGTSNGLAELRSTTNYGYAWEWYDPATGER